MKKTLAAVAVLGAFAGSALAADVTLYGKVDLGLQYTHEKSEDLVKHTDSTSHEFGMKSGGSSSSRFGLKGVEEISEGLKVGFQLEHGFNADQQEDTKLFSREMRLYVASDFGTLHMGRFGALDSTTGSLGMLGDMVATTGYLDVIADLGTVFHTNSRMANSIAYTSPEFAGITLSAMASLGEDHYNPASAEFDEGSNGKFSVKYDVDGKEGSSDVNRYYGLGAQGQWGGLGAGLVVSTEDYGDLKSNTMRKADNSLNVTGGVNYDFGVVKTFLAGNYYDNGLHTKQWGVSLSAVAPLGAGELEVGAGYGKAKEEVVDAKDKKSDAFTVGAHYKYPLSKRTYAYVAAGYAEEEVKDASKDKTFQAVSGICHNF